MNASSLVKNKLVQTAIISSATFGVGYLIGKRNGDVFEVHVLEQSEPILDETPKPDPNQQVLSLDEVVDGLVDTYIATKEVSQLVSEPRPRYNYNTSVIKDETNETEEAVTNAPIELTVDAPKANVLTVDTPTVNSNVFDNNPTDVWDEEIELSNRTSFKSYVITAEEFIPNSRDYEQETLTYYTQDNIMTDALETPIHRHEDIFGELLWGHGSGDKDLVYMRNEQMEKEWEIIRFEGSYEHEMLGNQIDATYAKQDAKRDAVPKMRDD